MFKQYCVKFVTSEEVKIFVTLIRKTECNAEIRSLDRKYSVDAKSIMGIFGMDLRDKMILTMDGSNEECRNFFFDAHNSGIDIEEM